MLNCHSIDPLVTPFIDGELPDADRLAVDEHSARLCAVSLAGRRRAGGARAHPRAGPRSRRRAGPLRAAMRRDRRSGRRVSGRAPGTPAAPTASPRSRPQSTSRRLPTRSRAVETRLAPFALAASLVVVVGGAFLYQATDRSARVMAAELTADHVKCFAMNSALGTHRCRRSRRELDGVGFDWRMHLPADPVARRARAGRRRGRVSTAKGKIAHIMYRHDGQPVSLFMLPKTARAEELVEVLGHEAAIWCAGNRTFVLIAREPRQDVERLASFVQASLR